MSITKGNIMPEGHPGHVAPGAKFWVVANQWNTSPIHATIFHSEDKAIRHIDDMRYYKRAGFGPDCIVDAVPLEGAIKTLGTLIQIRLKRPDKEA